MVAGREAFLKYRRKERDLPAADKARCWIVVKENGKMDEYAPKIIANWSQRALKREVPNGIVPVNGNLVLLRPALTEDLIRNELNKIREEFLQEAKKMEIEHIADIELKVRQEYEGKFEAKANELDRARRIINIQNAIISRLYEENKKVLVKVLKDAEISESDLKILAGSGEQ